MESAILGIDFGSKNTVISAIRTRGIEILKSDFGYFFPYICFFIFHSTSLSFLENERKIDTKILPHSTISCLPRFLGLKQDNPFFNTEIQYSNSKYISKENLAVSFEFMTAEGLKLYNIEQICAIFIQKIIQNIEQNHKIQCKSLVISVPQYFSVIERQCLIDATKIASLNCVKIINENSAMGLCYGLLKTEDFVYSQKNVIFIDMGYSKSTVSLLIFTKEGFRILSSAWEKNFGARDLDNIFVERVCQDFLTKYNKNLKENPKSMQKLREAISKMRENLTYSTETQIYVESIFENIDIYYNITRAEFEEIIIPFIEKLTNLIKSVLEDAFRKERLNEISCVELVGETTRIPIIISKIKEILPGVTIQRTMNSGDCIARGCAIQCAMLNSMFKVKDYGMLEYNSFPINISYNLPILDERGEAIRKTKLLFEKSCSFPILKSLYFDNRLGPLEIQLIYDQTNTNQIQPLIGNFKINPGTVSLHNNSKFTLCVKIILDQNMIPYIFSAEIIEDYFEEHQIKEENNEIIMKNDNFEDEKISQLKLENELLKTNIEKIHKKSITPLDFHYEVHGLSKKQIAEYKELEQIQQQKEDILINTRIAKNNLESYLYEFKSKLQNEYFEYVEPTILRELLNLVESTQNSINQNILLKVDFEQKLSAMQKIEEPIKNKVKLHHEISNYLIMLETVIKKANDFKQIKMSDEKYTNDEKRKLDKILKDVTKWYRQQHQICENTNKLLNPPITIQDLQQKIQAIEETVVRLSKKN